MEIINNQDGSISTLDALKGTFPDVNPIQVMLALAKAGLTNQEIEVTLGFKSGGLNKLLLRNPDLRDLFDEARDDPNYRVTQSLFKRAMGYQTKEITKKDGKPVQVVLKEVPADVVACIFWLKNRDPKKWRDIVEHKHTLRDRMERAHDSVSEKGRMREVSAGGGEE